MPKLIWSQTADRDLDDLHAWLLSTGDPELGARATQAVFDQCRLLQEFAAIGPSVAEDTRKLRVKNWPFIILYQLRDDGIHILRVRHQRSDWASLA